MNKGCRPVVVKMLVHIALTTVVVILSLIIVCTSPAKDVTLEWDANTESDLDGYRVYRSLEQDGQEVGIGSPDLVDIIMCEPNNPACCTYTDYNISDTMPFYYVVTAFDEVENESGKSNEVTSVILPPTNFRGGVL